MRHDDGHLSDEELVASIDGELRAGEIERAEAHLAACWVCRTRKQEVEDTIGDLVRLHRQILHRQLPPPAGRRALLKAQLAELRESHGKELERGVRIRSRPMAQIAAVCVTLSLGLFALALWIPKPANRPPRRVQISVPIARLTPGSTLPVSPRDVCIADHEKNRLVPASVRQWVFQEYGIDGADPQDYEVDYLVTPELGGSDDIRNLWPQSNSATVWNAQVKDRLEDRMHELVCQGALDLPTAQHEIATDWISAYKKYLQRVSPATLQ